MSEKTVDIETVDIDLQELIEELVLLGGGYGLFDGCAAGDTGAAVILKVKVD